MTYFEQEDALGYVHKIPAKAVLRAFYPEQGHTLSLVCSCSPVFEPDPRRTVIRHNRLEQ